MLSMSTNHTGGNTMQATEDTTYQGWTNYATWGVALVLDNDEGIYNAVREMAQEARDESVSRFQSRPNVTMRILSDRIKDYTEELCGVEDEPGPSLMARQVIQAGLAEVNWGEIARNILDES